MAEHKPNPPMPLELYVDLGDSVEWYAGGDPTLTPCVGVVIAKSPGFAPGTSNLTLAIYTGTGVGQRDGVMHMDNDRCRRQGNHGGGWRHRPIDFAFKQFMLAVGALKWNGDSNYVANPKFDPLALGAMLTLAMEQMEQPLLAVPPGVGKAGNATAIIRGGTGAASGQSPPSPPSPPVSPASPPPPA